MAKGVGEGGHRLYASYETPNAIPAFIPRPWENGHFRRASYQRPIADSANWDTWDRTMHKKAIGRTAAVWSRTGERLARSLIPVLAMLAPQVVHAEENESGGAIAWDAEYVGDVMAVAQGPATGTRYVDYLTLSTDVSLDKAVGWQGARLFLHGIASLGSQPNDLAGAIQGIDNIEAPDRRAKLYEAYLEQEFAGGRLNLRLGLSDLNTEFYVTDSAGLLLAPAFGIGSEVAATGSAGPSIFPSTAPMARLRYQSEKGTYAQFGVFSVEAGVPGDIGGIRPLFDQGALLIGEVGAAINGKIGIGGWTYTHKQDDIRVLTLAGDPEQRQAYGVYALLDQRLAGSDESGLNFFARIGISDGQTSPFSGGWQAGLLAKGMIPGRPESQLDTSKNRLISA